MLEIIVLAVCIGLSYAYGDKAMDLMDRIIK